MMGGEHDLPPPFPDWAPGAPPMPAEKTKRTLWICQSSKDVVRLAAGGVGIVFGSEGGRNETMTPFGPVVLSCAPDDTDKATSWIVDTLEAGGRDVWLCAHVDFVVKMTGIALAAGHRVRPAEGCAEKMPPGKEGATDTVLRVFFADPEDAGEVLPGDVFSLVPIPLAQGGTEIWHTGFNGRRMGLHGTLAGPLTRALGQRLADVRSTVESVTWGRRRSLRPTQVVVVAMPGAVASLLDEAFLSPP